MHKIRFSDGKASNIQSFERYIFEKCSEHKAEEKAFAFALIVYDFADPHISKILKDEKYLDALDYTSGKHLTVFYLHSEYVRHQSKKAKESRTIQMEFGIEKVVEPVNISPKYLGEKLINTDSLPSPSIIFFNTSGDTITDYTIARLRENEIEKGFNELLEVVKSAVGSLIKVKDENRDNDNEIFNLLKQSVDGSEFWKSAKSGFDKMMKLKDFIFFFKA